LLGDGAEIWRQRRGAPGLRPRYNGGFFAAYCHDPGGNKLCFVHAGGLGNDTNKAALAKEPPFFA
tara:strand:- start:945 stop:1139 length:195 start_codon:yes stop_codon:yes gene_type:complete